MKYEQNLAWEEEISENMMWIFSLVSSLHPVHLLPSRHLGVQSSEAQFLSSRLLYHILHFNLFSPFIFHPLPAIQYLFISPLLSLFLLFSAADCHLYSMSPIGK